MSPTAIALNEESTQNMISAQFRNLLKSSNLVVQLRKAKDALRNAQRENLQIYLERNQF